MSAAAKSPSESDLVMRLRAQDEELQVCRRLEEQMARALGWWDRDLAFWRNRARRDLQDERLISEIKIPE